MSLMPCGCPEDGVVEVVACGECGQEIVRPRGASSVCSNDHEVPATEARVDG